MARPGALDVLVFSLWACDPGVLVLHRAVACSVVVKTVDAEPRLPGCESRFLHAQLWDLMFSHLSNGDSLHTRLMEVIMNKLIFGKSLEDGLARSKHM